MSRLRLGCLILVALVAAAGIALWWFMREPVERRPVTASQQALARRIGAAGAAGIDANGRADGGMTVGGTLDGRQFALAVPPRWNGEALVFAHGYSIPGSPVRVARDPVAKDPSGGMMAGAYAQGFAVGHAAYDKAGMGVEAGAEATLRLKRLLDRAGARRVYLGGGSMGGNIVMALIERHPTEFAAAVAGCGVTDGWEGEIGALIDTRALYDYYTRGTDYALPGDPDLARSALSTRPPAGIDALGAPWRLWQMKRLANPIVALFDAAHADPRGREAAIVRRIASMAPFEAEPASFLFPLLTVALGMDDMRESFGGNVYGNAGKRYASPLLSASEIRELNRGVQRIAADPAAVAFARRWHQTTGRFTTPLVAVHNRVDSLVPYDQAAGLRARVAAAGNLDRLLQLDAPAKTASIPGTGATGYAHCGFTPRQTGMMFTLARRWVEEGRRPSGKVF